MSKEIKNIKPSLPEGTRDFSPEVVRKRQYILNTIKTIFELYGFQPIETPAMEKLETLTGKYGEEGDRLIFKIRSQVNLLDNLSEDTRASLKELLKIEYPYNFIPKGSNRALRYDLTIPFARYVVMHQNDIAFPFRRYQMQPVWRGDRPQKGRYREFWQCDADVIGTKSLISEAELISIYVEAFGKLRIPIDIKINNRKILVGLAEVCNIPDKFVDLTIALDKFDKIGWSGVSQELHNRGIHSVEVVSQIRNLIDILTNSTGNDYFFNELKKYFVGNVTGSEGVSELEKTWTYFTQISKLRDGQKVDFDIRLARGLTYYTGMIVEVICSHPDVKMGSIGGGGRYDDLTGLFGLKNLSGVGVSFGIDRIYDVMEELKVFPEQLAEGTQAMLVNFGGENETYALGILQQLRAAGIAAEIYPDVAKFDKQMKYANKRGIAYVLLPGDDERKNNKVSIKNFSTGEQKLVSVDECIATLNAGV